MSKDKEPRKRGKLLGGLIGVIVFCCGSLMIFGMIDSGLRNVGILPTRTPTTTPAPTSTATNTPLPTNTPVPTATSLPTNTLFPTSTSNPTDTPAPTNTIAPLVEPLFTPTVAVQSSGGVVIVSVNKSAEYVDIRNDSGATVNLSGWMLRSEKGSQDCGLSGELGAGQTLRIWAMTDDGGFNCNFGDNIWNNSEPDPAVLFNADGVEVSRR